MLPFFVSSSEPEMAGQPQLQIASDKVCFILMKARQFDEKEDVIDPDSARKASPGCPSGITRWQVSAVSLVLIGQICRSWMLATPISTLPLQ